MLTAIKNVTILTMNAQKDVIENGAVIIENDKIKDIGSLDILNKYTCEKVIDGEEGILIPGMINTHTHVSMTIARSLGDDVPNRLKKYIFPLEAKIVNKELVYLGAKYGIAEMLLGGVTTFVDMYYFEDEVAKACKELYIRGILGETVVDFPAPDSEKPYGGIEYSEWFIEKWKGDELVTATIAPHAPYTNDTEHLLKCAEIAKRFDTPIIMHVAEMLYEEEKYRTEYNMTVVEYLDSIGILNDKFISAHNILINDSDIEILNKHNVGIAHNPGANSKGGRRVAPIYKMYSKNMKVGLGSDGPMSGNTIDIVTQLPLVGKIHKMENKDRSIFPASEILEMATIGGARVIGRENELGSIEIGKKADMVLFETDSINMQPIYDPYSVVVYSANPSNVNTVMINGKLVVENRELKTVDVKELKKEFKTIRNEIKEKAKDF